MLTVAHMSSKGPEWPLMDVTCGNGGDGNIDGPPKEEGQWDGPCPSA
jgi:hypothetical protein